MEPSCLYLLLWYLGVTEEFLSPNHFELNKDILTFIPACDNYKSEKHRSNRTAKFIMEMSVALHKNPQLRKYNLLSLTALCTHSLHLSWLPGACGSQKVLEHKG